MSSDLEQANVSSRGSSQSSSVIMIRYGCGTVEERELRDVLRTKISPNR